MADIVLFGAGQIADVAVEYIERYSEDRIVGFTVDAEFKQGSSFRGRPLVEWGEIERHFPADQVMLLGPISYRRLNQFRRERYLEGKERGYRFASFIHPDCDILVDDIGENCFILERNIIQPFAVIGNNVIMWSSSYIAHHVTVSDHCYISTYVGIAGATTIGQGCFLGGTASVADNLVVGDNCFIGFAAVVSKSIPANSAVFAPPSKVKTSTPSLLQRLV